MSSVPKNRAPLGLAVVLVTVAVTAFALTGGVAHFSAGGGERITATFADVARLEKGNPVRVDGVKVGEVKDITLADDGRSTRVSFTADKDVLPLYADARAAVRWRTLLGGAYVVELDRGHAASGSLPGGDIPRRRTTSQVEVDQLLASVGGPERAGLRSLLQAVPPALVDPAAPAAALGTLADIAPDLTTAVRSLRGEHDGDLRRLVDNAAQTVKALDTPDASLRRMIGASAAVLQTTAARQADLRQTLQLTARTLPTVRATVRRLDGTLTVADPLIDRLRAPASAVAPTLRELRPTLVNARTLLDDATPLLRSLRPAASALARAAGPARDLLTGLTPSLDRANDKILPDFAKDDPNTGRPLYQMLGSGLSGLNGAAGSFDGQGHVIGLALSGGENAIDTTGCKSALLDPSAGQLVTCQALLDTFGKLLGGGPAKQGGR